MAETTTYAVKTGEQTTNVKAYSHTVNSDGDGFGQTLQFKNAQGIVVAEFRYWDSFVVKD